jgi:CDP-glycerol glycerophosphotransferase (TagB/SpsB family)
VTKDDLSNWINSKPIELMITVTPQEQAGIAGDYTPYVFTSKEVRLTGFPRHDRLLELRSSIPFSSRTILVMPTWRRELLDFSVGEGSAHPIRPDFWQTSFALSWKGFLESAALLAASQASGWKIVFVPHPLMQDCLLDSPLPSYIETRRFNDIDIQEAIAGAAVIVTDYSSNAFEAAYLQCPVVYFQFDRDAFFGGTHSYTKGSWSYEDDGFGPVVTTVDDAVSEVADVVARGGAPVAQYAKRMDTTFPFRDGKCCERTYQAIRDITRPLTYDELYKKLEDPDVLEGEVVEVPQSVPSIEPDAVAGG